MGSAAYCGAAQSFIVKLFDLIGTFVLRRPCRFGNAADRRLAPASWDSHPSEDRSEPPVDGSIIICHPLSSQSELPDLFPFSVGRYCKFQYLQVLAAETVSLQEKRTYPQHWYFFIKVHSQRGHVVMVLLYCKQLTLAVTLQVLSIDLVG